ncbi:GGDEF domain-containing protein [Luteibacter sp. PPL201]|uniref:diguanylate cyclase n=1 Tax=Luteibacter sahnii TaxID=3021977 RepID=A0ABT6B8W1_9GAMM
MKALCIALAVVVAHVVVLAAQTRLGMATSYASYVGMGALAIGAILHVRRRQDEAHDPRWWMLVASIVLWLVCIALAARQSVVLDNPNPSPGDSMFAYLLYVLPVLVTVSSAPVAAHRRGALAIDMVLVVLLGVLFYARTFSLVSLHGTNDRQNALELAWMFDLENVSLALAATLRFVATDSPADHRFFRAVASFFATYAVAGFIYNHDIALGDYPQFGATPWDVLLDLPFVALIASLAMTPTRRHWHPPVYVVRFVQGASPTFLAVSVLAFGLMVMDDHPPLGIAAAIAAVVGIGLRGTLAQVDLADVDARPTRRPDMPAGLVFIDRMTGLPNRRAFDDRLLHEWQRPVQEGPIALLVIGIDFLREYNDRYGRAAGDECLRMVAAMLLARGTRAGDLLVRFRGAEFALLAPGTSLRDAVTLADELREHIQAQAIVHALSAVGVVTATIGVAALRASGHLGAPDLVSTAERALQRTRRGGHNRVGTLGTPHALPVDPRDTPHRPARGRSA